MGTNIHRGQEKAAQKLLGKSKNQADYLHTRSGISRTAFYRCDIDS